MKSYVYHGPLTGLSLADAKGKIVWEGMLVPGRMAEGLPVDHPHVVTLVAGKLLVEADSTTPPVAPKRGRPQQEA